MTLRGKVAIVGIGELPTRRVIPGRTMYGLCAEAARIAVADAGLTKQDIDGLVTDGTGRVARRDGRVHWHPSHVRHGCFNVRGQWRVSDHRRGPGHQCRAVRYRFGGHRLLPVRTPPGAEGQSAASRLSGRRLTAPPAAPEQATPLCTSDTCTSTAPPSSRWPSWPRTSGSTLWKTRTPCSPASP